MPTTYRITAALRHALEALPRSELLPPEEAAVAERLGHRIRRDLLPRLQGAEPTLLVAIAGPNNVGKSSLFNSLVGREASPARAQGGLTRQSLAAAAPDVVDGEMRRILERHYEVVPVADPAAAPVTTAGPPGRVFLFTEPSLPAGVLVMDTPDFDSVFRTNRAAAEALLVTADLVVFVVSRHTYQNAALVEFLRDAVGRGRPYVLLHNESPTRALAVEHLAKLAADVGRPPAREFFAPPQPEVQAGGALLATEPLDGGPPLRALLEDRGQREDLKRRALEASLRHAAAEIGEVAGALAAAARQPDRLRERLRHELLAVGERAARSGVPADVLLEAFQDELDERSGVNRVVRRGMRRVGGALAFVGRRIRQSLLGPGRPVPPGGERVELELREGLRRSVLALSREVAAWHGDERTGALLAEAFGPETLDRLHAGLELPELDAHADERELYRFCRELVARELEGGRREQLLQLATTLVYSLPMGTAGIVSIATGGVGQDAAVWVAAAVSTPVLERLVDLLGKDLRDEVTRRWAEEHGRTLAAGLERELFGALLERLDGLVAESMALAERLAAAREELDGADAGRSTAHA